jgi:hypothetical protein
LTRSYMCGALWCMRTPHPPDSGRVRLTISVTPEVHDTFQLLAEASGMSLSRAMGEWLEDTRDGAAFMADTMRKARQAPKLVARELHAYALGLGDMTSELLEDISAKAKAGEPAGDARRAPRAASRPGPTPPSNTGVTTASKKTRKGGTDGRQDAR